MRDKESASSKVFGMKARRLRRPIRISTLLKKLSAPVPAASPVSNTRGAGTITPGLGRAVGAGSGLTPPPPISATKLPRNLFAQSQKPGNVGFGQKTQSPQLTDLGVPRLGVPAVGETTNESLVKVQMLGKLAVGEPPAPTMPMAPGGLPAPAPITPAPPAPAQSQTPQEDFSGVRPVELESPWNLQGVLSGATQGALTGAMLPGVAMLPGAVGGAAVGAVGGPALTYAQRHLGGTDPGEAIPDVHLTQEEALQRLGVSDKAGVAEQFAQNPEEFLSTPWKRNLAAFYGLVPGGGRVIPAGELQQGVWDPEGKEYTGETAAWEHLIRRGAEEEPERYAMLSQLLGPKEASNRAASIRKAAQSHVVTRIRDRLNHQPSLSDRIKIAAIMNDAGLEKTSQWWKLPAWALGGTALLGAGAARAITPSEQQVPGLGPLARFGLGLGGGYAGYKGGQAIQDYLARQGGDTPWYSSLLPLLGAGLGSQLLPGALGSVMSGQPGQLLSNPLLGGAAGYFAYPHVAGALGLNPQDPTSRLLATGIGAAGVPLLSGLTGIGQ